MDHAKPPPAADRELRARPLSRLDFLVLAALADRPRHGYGLVVAIDEQTDGRVAVRPGDLYRVLYRLSRRGLVAAGERRERRNLYRLTRRGERALRAEARLLHAVAESVLTLRRTAPETP